MSDLCEGVDGFVAELKRQGIHLGIGRHPVCVCCGEVWPCGFSLSEKRSTDSQQIGEWQRSVTQHICARWPNAKRPEPQMIKMTEELGEVAGAFTRHAEGRDGRSWMPEIIGELGDLAVTFMSLCSSLGLSADEVVAAGVKKCLTRTWSEADR